LVTVRRAEFGEETPEFAPILHQYGKALLENAIASSNVLGGNGIDEEKEEDEYEPVAAPKDSTRFSFGGDVEEDDAEPTSEKSLKRKVPEALNPPLNEEDKGNEDDDDMGVAFTVLDFARVLYERILEGSGSDTIGSSKGKDAAVAELKLITGEKWDKDAIVMDLAEVRNDLGDVGLETGTFLFLIQKTSSRLLRITVPHWNCFSLFCCLTLADFQMHTCDSVLHLNSIQI